MLYPSPARLSGGAFLDSLRTDETHERSRLLTGNYIVLLSPYDGSVQRVFTQ